MRARPDFSGEWTLNVAASTLSPVVAPVVQSGFVHIKHREPSVSVHLRITMDGNPIDVRFERAYLETRFEGGDGAQPYVKWRYGSRTPVVRSRAGYLERSGLPRKLSVKPAPVNDPFPPMTLEQPRE